MKMLSPDNRSRTFPCPLVAPDEDVRVGTAPVDVVEGADGDDDVIEELLSSWFEMIGAVEKMLELVCGS